MVDIFEYQTYQPFETNNLLFDQESKYFAVQYFQIEIVFHFLLCENSWDVKISSVWVENKLLIFPTGRQFNFPHFSDWEAIQTNVYFYTMQALKYLHTLMSY